MEILTLKPLRTMDTIDIDVVALDESGATLTCTVQLTKDLSDILSVVPDDNTPMTDALLTFARSEVREYIKTHGSELAALLK